MRTSALRDEHDQRGKELEKLKGDNEELKQRHKDLLNIINEARLEEQK